MNVLVVNSGSSSEKFQVISTDLERIGEHKDDRLCRGDVEGIGVEAIIRFQHRAGDTETMTASLRDITAALGFIVRHIASHQSGVPEINGIGEIHAVGHRVVHGGELFHEPLLLADV